MARLNLEDSIFTDARFFNLCLKLKSRNEALGALMWAWKVAQRTYLEHDGNIPFDTWRIEELRDEIIDVGLAEKTETGVRMKGVHKHFEWLRQKQTAGKNSGLSRSKSMLTELNGIERKRTETNGAEPLTLSLSLKEKEELRTKERVNAPDEISQDLVEGKQNPTELVKRAKKKEQNPDEGNQDFAQLVGSVVSVYQKKFKARPALGGKEIGILKRLSRDYKSDVLINLLETFFQMRDKWFETKAWDLATFEQNIHKVSISLQTGRELTGATNVLDDFLKEHTESISLGVRDETR